MQNSNKNFHPIGMYILALTEVFERLSFFTLIFLLVLYVSSPTSENGLGWSKADALTLSGLFMLAAYIFPIIGSLLADKYLGHYRSILLGGGVILLGHIFMFFSENITFLYLALFFIALGTAFFKPCIPVLIGNLYKWNDPRRESGYCWYYCGINIGIMFAGITSGLLLQKFGYHVALSSAGFGMVLGILVFILGRKHLVLSQTHEADLRKGSGDLSLLQLKALSILLLSLCFFCLWAIIYNLCTTGTLSLFIEHNTHKVVFNYDIPVAFFSALQGLTIIVATPFITSFLAKRSAKNKYPHFFSQMNFALLVCTVSLIYFTILTLKFNKILYLPKPFYSYEIAFFLFIFTLSEAIINPIMMSAISLIAPEKLKSFFQSIYLACYGIAAFIAAKIGAYALENPFKIYLWVTVFVLFSTLFYFLIKRKMIHIVDKAMLEKNSCQF
ncbi:peptide MFS transporter [Fluviispira sanaruensis]|uniref:MFS transporter n=1 Tax=Fluviispira sanaruensis TaxID=2493639 RepID=A0A4P2VLM4_FLUSA|nr:oligopeptide:H+ symporter [Fluviispira sanaruensis]BBH52874.1 MFS transporter [Fluviispira sanaruensis]